MPIEVLMPALSPTMKKGKLIKWCVNVGDSVEIGQTIAEVETDKATMEVEAFEDGKIGSILIKEGTADVSVNSPIAIILLDGENIDDIKKEMLTEQKIPNKETSTTDTKNGFAEEQKRIKASPLAKHIAKINNIAIAEIKIGSGPYGRIIKQDVLNSIKNSVDVEKNIKQTGEIDNKTAQPSYSELSTMRSVIAKRLVESKQKIPHFYLTIDCNLDRLLTLKEQLADNDIKITINDFVIKATACALQQFPEINSSWDENRIQHYNSVDVAIAVSLEDGLITPIIRKADTKSLQMISSEVKALAIQAKAGTLSRQQYQGGGITISNLGMFKIKEFVAIINPPQSSILAIGVSEERVTPYKGEIKISTMMTMNLSVDHRVIDGASGAQFFNKIKYYLENPLKLLAL